MPEIDQLFPSKFLKTADLDGHEVTVTIERVAVEAAGKRQQSKPVLYFVGKKKGLILNRTNADAIAAIVGSTKTEAWAGKTIRLFVTETQFQGRPIPAIRIKKAAV